MNHTNVGVSQTDNSDCSTTKNSKQNPNPNEGVVAAKKVPSVVQDPLDAPLMGPNMIHDPKTKRRGVAIPW